jgi:hypothetical protein
MQGKNKEEARKKGDSQIFKPIKPNNFVDCLERYFEGIKERIDGICKEQEHHKLSLVVVVFVPH